jgi:heme/copper-type cytochrome/quinol oxidase subunit 2
MKVMEVQETDRIVVTTIVLVLISLIVAVFVAYFFGSLLGQW